MSSGVYKIVCTENGREYIGQSSDINKRFNAHKKFLNLKYHDNSRLQDDYNKFGPSKFDFSVVLTCSTEESHLKEQELIRQNNPYYNIMKIKNMAVGSDDVYTFMSKVKILDNGCWTICGIKNIYYAFRTKDSQYPSHRVSYYIFNGNFDISLFVCHKCNNKYCCNPNHLYLATSKQNSIDARNQGLSSSITIEIANEIRVLAQEIFSSVDICKIINDKYNLDINFRTVQGVISNKIFYDNKYVTTKRNKNMLSDTTINNMRKDYINGMRICDVSKKHKVPIQCTKHILKNRTRKDESYNPNYRKQQ